MLLNPFTPSEIAANPEAFFGRQHELHIMERSIQQGSVAIQGAIGIGKSSLLSRTRLLMEGFDSTHKCVSAICTGYKDVKNIDEAARLLLESFVSIDESSSKIKVNLGKIIEIESAQLCKNFSAGRHLATLIRFMEKKNLGLVLNQKEYLILAIDEVDKCPVPIAQLVRALSTHIQQNGINNVRFVVAGVNPFFQNMISEDSGISRFFYKVLTLDPMTPEESTELIITKFDKIVKDAKAKKIPLRLDSLIVRRVVNLSGGHPHILQLMGSHLIEHENEDPDGIIDSKDLVTTLRTICYEDRSYVYESTIHLLELHSKLEILNELLAISPKTFPTLIDRRIASDLVNPDDLKWFADNNIINIHSEDYYGLVDEFLRIRLTLDEGYDRSDEIESKMIKKAGITELDEELVDAYGYGIYDNNHSEDLDDQEEGGNTW